MPDSPDNPNVTIPWWKTPSPLWLFCLVPFASTATALTLAPRIGIYTFLACKAHSPDIFGPSQSLLSGSAGWHELLPKIPAQVPQHCASDPMVQAVVAKLVAAIAASTGILSCLTGAWWGAFSDRHGRTSVLAITVTGALVTDLNFILVALFTDKFPGGYWFLITGPLIEGALGGIASGSAASHAYMADTTTEESRSRVFSLSLGLVFTGIALGPAMGSILLRSTGQLLSVFFLSAVIHVTYALVVLFIVPESLTEQKMQAFRRKHEEQHREASNSPVKSAAAYVRGLFRFLAPLAVLIPSEPAGGGGKDWSLMLVAIAYGLAIGVVGVVSYVLQYAASTYGWSPEALGYYVTLMGTTRATMLVVVFPLIVKYLWSKRTITELHLEPSEEEPLLSDRNANASGPSIVRKELHSPSFDLTVARLCLIVEVIVYGALSFPLSALPYILFAVLGSVGACLGPALQSAALAIYTRKGHAESGRLFGGIGVVQALCAQIIAPFIYGFVYAETVAWFPRAIFVVSMTAMSLSFLCLTMVRLPKGTPQHVQCSDVEASDCTVYVAGEVSEPVFVEDTTAED